MSRAITLIALASLAIAAGCSDQPALPTAPTSPSALVSPDPNPATYSVSVDPVVILSGFSSSYNFATGVNSLGEIGGVSALDGGPHAARWAAGSTTASDVGAGESHDLNDAGQHAGEVGGQAALWTPDGSGGYTLTSIAKQLPSPIISSAYGINANGQVVGTYRVIVSEGVWVDRCFLWTPSAPNAPTGTATTLPDFGGNFCVANDINSNGYVVGAATTVAGETHGFIWSPGSFGRLGRMQDLTPRGGQSYATSINNLRQVAGQHITDTQISAAIWNPTSTGTYTVVDLGTFTGDQAWAMDINDDGFVIGWARHSNSADDDGFIWQNGDFTLLPGIASTTEPTAMTNLNGGSSLQVVGVSYDAVTNARAALRWNVTVTPLESPPPAAK